MRQRDDYGTSKTPKLALSRRLRQSDRQTIMSHQKPPHCHCHGVTDNQTDRRLWHIKKTHTSTVTETKTIRQTDDYVTLKTPTLSLSRSLRQSDRRLWHIKNPHTVTVTESQTIRQADDYVTSQTPTLSLSPSLRQCDRQTIMSHQKSPHCH